MLTYRHIIWTLQDTIDVDGYPTTAATPGLASKECMHATQLPSCRVLRHFGLQEASRLCCVQTAMLKQASLV